MAKTPTRAIVFCGATITVPEDRAELMVRTGRATFAEVARQEAAETASAAAPENAARPKAKTRKATKAKTKATK